jgi:hypothetical protein
MSNEIAGFSGSAFVFLVILSELTVQCVTNRYLQTRFLHITCVLCLYDMISFTIVQPLGGGGRSLVDIK